MSVKSNLRIVQNIGRTLDNVNTGIGNISEGVSDFSANVERNGWGSTLSDIGDGVNNRISAFADNVTDSVKLRLQQAGLMPGGEAAITAIEGAPTDATTSVEKDWRLRLSVGQTSGIFYRSSNPGVMAPLQATRGVIFPYTPTVSVQYQTNYSAVQTTHSIQSPQSYQNSDVTSINVTGTYTAQTQSDADYLLAVIQFFRSAGKMFFGTADNKNNVGSPPPIIFLNGFGERYFPNVPCVLTSFVHNVPDDVDFVRAGSSKMTAMVPTQSTITITLVPQYSRQRLAGFNLDSFARGDLINNKGNFL